MKVFRISDHAALRWMDRFEPQHSDLHAAKEKLRQLCSGMQDTGNRRQGKRLYTHPDWPWVLFCVAHDLNQPIPTLVTVLDSPHNYADNGTLVAGPRRRTP